MAPLVRETLLTLVATPANAAMSVFLATSSAALAVMAGDVLRMKRNYASRAAVSLEAARIMATPLPPVADDPVEHAIDDRVRAQAARFRGVAEDALVPARMRPVDAAERRDSAAWRAANPGDPRLW